MPAPGYTNQTQTAFGTNLGRSAVDLQVFDGELYYLTRSGGAVYRIEHSSPSEPDLTVTSVNGPIEGRIGGTINVSSAVAQNQGSVSAGATRIGFYFSTDPAGDPSQTFSNSSCPVPALAGGASDNCVNTPVQVPTVSPGLYSLVAIVDDNDAVLESNENNNDLADSNQITLIDCATAGPENNCLDGIDNDCDEAVDQDDPDCQAACRDSGQPCMNADQCCSGKCKGKNPTCKGEASCTPTETPDEESCFDGQDNDCDGFTDAGDADCICMSTEGPEVSCEDTIDNDCDGFVDFSDTDCCKPKGDSCSVDDECCSNKCRGPSGNMSCK